MAISLLRYSREIQIVDKYRYTIRYSLRPQYIIQRCPSPAVVSTLYAVEICMVSQNTSSEDPKQEPFSLARILKSAVHSAAIAAMAASS